MGNPKIHIPQNCKVKLVYRREQLKARVKFWILFGYVDFVQSVSLTEHVTFEYSESVMPKHRPRSVQTVQPESFLSCTCLRLKF